LGFLFCFGNFTFSLMDWQRVCFCFFCRIVLFFFSGCSPYLVPSLEQVQIFFRSRLNRDASLGWPDYPQLVSVRPPDTLPHLSGCSFFFPWGVYSDCLFCRPKTTLPPPIESNVWSRESWFVPRSPLSSLFFFPARGARLLCSWEINRAPWHRPTFSFPGRSIPELLLHQCSLAYKFPTVFFFFFLAPLF